MNAKRAILLSLAMMLTAVVAVGETPAPPLTKVESKQVCMINEQYFEKEQIPVEVDGKTYFGCCSMCKDRLANDPESRFAVDPVSGKQVDKATAVIAADADGRVAFFENEKNLKAYNKRAVKKSKG